MATDFGLTKSTGSCTLRKNQLSYRGLNSTQSQTRGCNSHLRGLRLRFWSVRIGGSQLTSTLLRDFETSTQKIVSWYYMNDQNWAKNNYALLLYIYIYRFTQCAAKWQVQFLKNQATQVFICLIASESSYIIVVKHVDSTIILSILLLLMNNVRKVVFLIFN